MKYSVCGVILVLSFLVSGCQLRPQPSVTPLPQVEVEQNAVETFQDRQKVTIQLATRSATVEVVNSIASITQGLSGRPEIGSEGMLFILGQTRVPIFWMKDMKFDLDMVWFKDQQVVDITRMVPKPSPGTPDSKLPLIQPNQPADMVLELPAGTAENWGIQVGDSLDF
jgi:uncharacterized membrane protein (UPF0127 family)